MPSGPKSCPIRRRVCWGCETGGYRSEPTAAPPLPRKFVLSCSQHMQACYAARRNRPMRASPARLPPTLRTEMPRRPRLASRPRRNRPASSTRRSPKCEASLSIARRSRSPSRSGNGRKHRTQGSREAPRSTLSRGDVCIRQVEPVRPLSRPRRLAECVRYPAVTAIDGGGALRHLLLSLYYRPWRDVGEGGSRS